MAEEFSKFLDQTREAPIREKVDGLSEIIEKMMMLIMSIPDSVDKLIIDLNDRINAMDSHISDLNSKIVNLKVGSPTASGAPNIGATSSRVSATPGAPPPPPGAPPRPGAPPPTPANPVSLRSSIMGELKELFKKRREWENE